MIVRLLLLLSLSLLAGCDDPPPYHPRLRDQPPPLTPAAYRFAIHPQHTPARLHHLFAPLATDLERHVPGLRLRLVTTRDYADFDRRLLAGAFHFALPNPYQTVLAADRGYRIFAKMGDDEDFRGILVIRRDGGIERIEDLRGKTLSFPAPSALAATLLPLYFLAGHGLRPGRDFHVRYVGSQESAIMSVYLGESAAGGTWPPPWRGFAKERPQQAARLLVRWRTDPLPNNGLVARADVPEALVAGIRERLVHLHEDPAGRALLAPLGLSRFEPAERTTYEPVRRFLARYRERLGPLPHEAAP